MKSIRRFGVTLGLIGSMVVLPALTGIMSALALPQNAIVEKLQNVPVFTITDAQGAPLTALVPEGDKQTTVAGVFISQQDAQAFIEKLKSKNPQLAQSVKVVPVSLAEVYQMEQKQENGEDALEIAYVPKQQQVSSALELLRQQGQQVNQFNGVPMFIATGGDEKGYLTIEREGQQIIPIFFNQEDLQGMISRLQPEVAQQVKIKVVDLESVIDTLQTSDDPQLNSVVLIPPRETLEYLKTLNPAGQPQAPAPQR